MAEERMDVFLSCFKCGRIVRAGDSECPRCGLQFGPGTLFECPFCSGLVWRNASKCSTCGTNLTEFSISVERTFAGFDMDEFVENIINTELEQLRSSSRKVACPGCGLMIRGDEEKCPRCDL
ncbi:MAG: zinc ribbon domain-containing protein, partial [Thermoplasmata archaeon]|nr:zinc ribbon domain-containing protein [Thermoplasmata archaeon]